MSSVAAAWSRQSYMRANDLDYRRNIENQVETMCNVMETAAAGEGWRRFWRSAGRSGDGLRAPDVTLSYAPGW